MTGESRFYRKAAETAESYPSAGPAAPIELLSDVAGFVTLAGETVLRDRFHVERRVVLPNA